MIGTPPPVDLPQESMYLSEVLVPQSARTMYWGSSYITEVNIGPVLWAGLSSRMPVNGTFLSFDKQFWIVARIAYVCWNNLP